MKFIYYEGYVERGKEYRLLSGEQAFPAMRPGDVVYLDGEPFRIEGVRNERIKPRKTLGPLGPENYVGKIITTYDITPIETPDINI